MQSHRSLRTALVAVLALAVAATPHAASASPPDNAGPVATKLRVDSMPSAPAFERALVSVQDTMIMSHVDTIAGVHVVQLSPRTRESIQIAAVNHALRNAMRSGAVEPGSFNRSLIDALVDDVGPEVASTIAKSYRPEPHAYRNLLRAIRDRSRSSAARAD